MKSVLWRGIDRPGHEACRVFSQNAEWRLAGTAVFSHNDQPCRLDYLVVCDADWNSLSGKVSGWVGRAAVNIEVAVDPERSWRLNGIEYPSVAGRIDLDLNFSPSTNLLPIRRLNLAIGQEAEVKAAWLRFPSFELEALDQFYLRVDGSTIGTKVEVGALSPTWKLMRLVSSLTIPVSGKLRRLRNKFAYSRSAVSREDLYADSRCLMMPYSQAT